MGDIGEGTYVCKNAKDGGPEDEEHKVPHPLEGEPEDERDAEEDRAQS